MYAKNYKIYTQKGKNIDYFEVCSIMSVYKLSMLDQSILHLALNKTQCTRRLYKSSTFIKQRFIHTPLYR